MRLPLPSVAVAVTLASIAAHAREAISPTGHSADLASAEALLSDPEVLDYMAALDKLALLPVPR